MNIFMKVMLRIEVENGKIERALKQLKRKVRNVKQNQELRDRKQFTKDSVKDREEKIRAIYIQKLREENED